LETVDLPGAEKSELKFAAEVNRLKSGPNSGQKLQRKESELRRMIGKLENDIALWRNNLEFFAASKTADKLRNEFSKKIQEASEQLDELKEELKVLNKID
jgi:succinylglutamate desuccinylase